MESDARRDLRSVRSRAARGVARRAVRRALGGALVLTLPFFVLLRSSAWLYGTGRLGTWSALAAGAGLTVLLLAGYAMVAARFLNGRLGVPKRVLQGLAVGVVAYCAYGLAFFSAANAAGDAVRAEYRSLHPLLRMAVSTLVLADGHLLVTDAARQLDDYAAMGLPPNERSLHLEQPDGWAHALDLRTTGRGSIRNGLTRLYFAALGYRTLRHGGTGDHLHVSLPLPSDDAHP